MGRLAAMRSVHAGVERNTRDVTVIKKSLREYNKPHNHRMMR